MVKGCGFRKCMQTLNFVFLFKSHSILVLIQFDYTTSYQLMHTNVYINININQLKPPLNKSINDAERNKNEI